MRRALHLALPVLVLCLTGTAALAGDNGGCGGLFGGHCPGGHRQVYEGQDTFFNCGCNGSYKHPVPPLSTYHWPGMFSHQLMTDYHSPWRFPPIKPYKDENPTSEALQLRPVRQISAHSHSALPRVNSLRMSERMRHYFR